MPVSYVSGSGGFNSHWTGNYTITYGVTASAGDIQVLIVWHDNGFLGGQPVDPGWTTALVVPDVSGVGGAGLMVYWKEASGTETGVDVERISVGTQFSRGTAYLVSGADTAALAETPISFYSPTTTVAAPGGTVAEDDSMVVFSFIGGGDVTSGPDVGTLGYNGTDADHVYLAQDTGTSPDCTVTKSFSHTLSVTTSFDAPGGAGGTDPLTGQDIASGVPTVTAPALGQEHALSGLDVLAGVPSVDSPTLGQAHALAGLDISSAPPVVTAPVLGSVGGTDALTGQDIAAAPPTVSAPALGQVHALTGQDVEAGSPIVGVPVLGQVHALTGLDVSTAPPTVTFVGLSYPEVVLVGSQESFASLLSDSESYVRYING